MRVLVTGGAGFIGAALSQRLLARGDQVTVVDNLNDYYAVSLKQARLDRLAAAPPLDAPPVGGGRRNASPVGGGKTAANFTFRRLDIADRAGMAELFADGRFEAVLHLAAQAGVRHSIDHPEPYIDANLVGFGNVLEGCRSAGVGHLVYASSSSVYGDNATLPFAEEQPADQPVSLYGATKRANELMAHAYASMHGLAATGLRFFTVYGPWGRPDMAFFKFTRLMLAGQKIPVHNNGRLARDFTYIDDIVAGALRVLERPPAVAPPHRLYNIGRGAAVNLLDYIHALEEALGVTARCEMLPMQPGEAPVTCADTTRLQEEFDYRPATPITTGLQQFVAWHREYYNHRRPEDGISKSP